MFNRFTFTGQAWDAGVGLYNYKARYYNPATGRFLTQDTQKGSLWAPWTQNLYSYVGNNPVNMIDPTGHVAMYDDGGGGGDKTPPAMPPMPHVTVCEMCSTSSENGPVLEGTFNVFKAEVTGPHGELYFGAGEVTGRATTGAGLGGEVNALHLRGSLVPTWYLEDGTPVFGVGGGVDMKILGAKANAGIVDYSLKLGAEAYVAKAAKEATVRLWHAQITYAVEACWQCVGASGSVGKEFSGFLAWGAGAGVKLKFDYVPNAH